jgi:hypothetical protein
MQTFTKAAHLILSCIIIFQVISLAPSPSLCKSAIPATNIVQNEVNKDYYSYKLIRTISSFVYIMISFQISKLWQ